MEIIQTKIKDLLIIQPKLFSDERGFFLETYQSEKYQQAGIPHTFVQDNHSGSVQGTLRGLHYQIKQPQGKLVSCPRGKLFDVAVDIRKSSPTFGQHVGVILSEENRRQFWVPPGFAHGFYAMSKWAELTYKATDYYAPEWDRTLLWNDSELGVEWPLIEGVEVLLSEKDQKGKSFAEADLFE